MHKDTDFKKALVTAWTEWAPNARVLLLPYDCQLVTFTGTVNRATTAGTKRRTELRALLITNVRINGTLVADHVWIEFYKHMNTNFAGTGEVIECQGHVTSYLKKGTDGGMLKDLKISNVKFVRKV